jgi:hypothetical protein
MFDIRQMPLCQAAAVGVVNALPRDREDASVGEQKLFDGTFGGCMGAIRGVALELWAIEGRDATLSECEQEDTTKDIGKRTHLIVAGPQQFLGCVKCEGRYRRRRVMGSSGR